MSRLQEEQVLAAEWARFEALLGNDIALVDGLLAPELTYIHSNGARQTKAEYLQPLAAGKVLYKSIVASDQQIQIVGDAAVVTGTVKLLVNTGFDRSMEAIYTEVYVKRDGRWLLLLWQSTLLSQ